MKIFNKGNKTTIETNEERLENVFIHNAFLLAEQADEEIIFYPNFTPIDQIWYDFFTDNEIQYTVRQLAIHK